MTTTREGLVAQGRDIMQWHKEVHMKKLLIALVAIIGLTTIPVPTTNAISVSNCTFAMNNGLLHPTWKATCNYAQYRAKAWCQVAYAYGDWVTKGQTSTATCFFVYVDKPKSGVEIR